MTGTFITRWTVDGKWLVDPPFGARFVAEHEVNGERIQLYVKEPSYTEGWNEGYAEGYHSAFQFMIQQVKKALQEDAPAYPRGDMGEYAAYSYGFTTLKARILDVLRKYEEPKKNV